MEARPLAGLISSLVSQALVLLLLLFQSNNHPNFFLPFSLSQTLTSLLHLLSSSHITAAASSSTSRPRCCLKRKRLSLQINESDLSVDYEDHEEEEEDDDDDIRLIHDDNFMEETAKTPCTALALYSNNPDHFKLFVGMRSTTFEWLASLLDPLIDSRDPTGFNFRLPTTTRLALALSRLATGATYSDLASRFSVSEMAARFCSRHLCRVLCTNFRFWLAFPSSPDSLHPISAGFSSLAGLPGCCGAIASARFNLHRGPATTFLVADVSSRILSFAAIFRPPRNSEGLEQSSLYKEAMEGRLLGPDQYLVGDESQQLYPWLMVPFGKPVPGSCEEDFNMALRVMCWPARRAIYSLHNWRVLGRLEEEEEGTKASVAIIGTCALLHNVLLMKEDDSSLADVGEDYLLGSEQQQQRRQRRRRWRDDGEEKNAAADKKKAVLIRNCLAVKARECGSL